MDIEIAHKIATALAVPLQDVLGIEIAGRGFADDMTPYEAGPADPLRNFVDGHRFLYRTETGLLDLAGINAGDVLVINDSADACRDVRPLQVVSVLYHPTSNGKAVHLLRQFVPPRLLITNSSRGNEKSIDIETEQATIVGVVESIHRKFGGSTSRDQ